MNKEANAVKVSILDKDYLVACAESECDALHESARHLNRKMQEIRASGKIIGLDRIAVMAALNITHEMLQQRRNGIVDDSVSECIQRLQDKVELALSDE
jgi:cell division protein ZapA